MFFFMLFWCCGWLLGEVVVLLVFVLVTFGRQTIELTPEALRIRSTVAGFGRSREYPIDAIQGLRVEQAVSSRGARMGYHIAFDIDGKKRTFAPGVTEDEANFIRDQLVQRDNRLTER